MFEPVLARTSTIHRPVGPVAYDCVKFIIVRDGSAILFSEFGERPVRPGDVVLLGANVLCASEPEGHVTVTTIYADTDFLLDQLFWQYADVLRDRLDAQGFADTIYTEPAQVLRLGEDRSGMLMPWLDELVALSVDGHYRERFHRMQALWHAIIDQIAPYIRITPYRTSPHQRARLRPTLPRGRRFAPLRAEARQVRDVLRSDIARSWGLAELAGMVHLSTKQLSRVFVDAYGKTPLTYLTMLRDPRGHPQATQRKNLAPRSRRARFERSTLRGGKGTRTPNPLLAKQVRYQLRHAPVKTGQSSGAGSTPSASSGRSSVAVAQTSFPALFSRQRRAP